MNQEQNQGPQQYPQPNQPTVQDDQLAAALGFITTLSQVHMGMGQPQPQEKPQETAPKTPPEAPKQPQETSSAKDPDKKRDDAMEKEIADIRAELEQLKADEQNDATGTTNQNTQSPS